MTCVFGPYMHVHGLFVPRRIAKRIEKELMGDAGRGFAEMIKQLTTFLGFNSQEMNKLRSCDY